MEHLRGTMVHYPWGNFETIHDLLGTTPDGRPLAEFWLGAHASAPSALGRISLDEALRQQPSLLGEASMDAFGPQLPFMMKILSARHALSLQAHPDRAQAEQGFAAEQDAGVPVGAPERIYKDAWPKPEIIVALSEFHTLSGFRDPARSAALVAGLGLGPGAQHLFAPLSARGGQAALQEVFLDLLAMDEARLGLVDEVLAAAMRLRDTEGELGQLARTALELDDVFPRDPGILAALLMNRVELSAGEALYTPAGRLHAHLRGTGIEVMASSDNVLRGGLTSKHIAVDELVKVVDFGWGTPEVLAGHENSPGVFDYPTHCREFDVWRVEVRHEATVTLPSPTGARIVLVTRGQARLASGQHSLELGSGDAAFIPADSAAVTASGDADMFLAAAGLDQDAWGSTP